LPVRGLGSAVNILEQILKVILILEIEWTQCQLMAQEGE
jgi:hypothetical protein